MGQEKAKNIRKPPASRQSHLFRDKEQAVLNIVGDEYWDWLEKQYDELIINYTISKNK